MNEQPSDMPNHQPARRHDANGGARPIIGITMGDPAGIGAEVIVKALVDDSLRRKARFVLYGQHETFSYVADMVEVAPLWFRAAHDAPRRVESGVLLADFDDIDGVRPGLTAPSREGGVASMRFLDDAITDLKSGAIDAVVTGPISKTSWKMAGFDYPGHTELFAHRFKTSRVTMMFVGGPLRVALVSIHEALFEVRHSFTIGRVFQPIDLLNQALREWFGISEPHIAVAGLNPHASEGGMFGDEESRIIEPAILMAREHGVRVDGPLPADTLFRRAALGEYDGVVAMYHDQGLIPVKLLAFDSSVNLTLGLPVIRTSVDHGTAFDIVGRNKADCGSMKAAIDLAIELAGKRRTRKSCANGNGDDAPNPASQISAPIERDYPRLPE